jgi:citrate synthase
MNEQAELNGDGNKALLPLIKGTAGERTIDISKLRDQTGLITLDSGYGNMGSCQSAITFIGGGKGILRYRGIPIEELAGHEVARNPVADMKFAQTIECIEFCEVTTYSSRIG